MVLLECKNGNAILENRQPWSEAVPLQSLLIGGPRSTLWTEIFSDTRILSKVEFLQVGMFTILVRLRSEHKIPVSKSLKLPQMKAES